VRKHEEKEREAIGRDSVSAKEAYTYVYASFQIDEKR
jgi:hypothetical protein